MSAGQGGRGGARFGRHVTSARCRGSAYRLLEHNCNHFSDEVAQFLCGARVPKHILEQPERALPPPLRLALQALLDNVLPDAQVGGAGPAPIGGGPRGWRPSAAACPQAPPP